MQALWFPSDPHRSPRGSAALPRVLLDCLLANVGGTLKARRLLAVVTFRLQVQISLV